jgi:hypothetical protein
MMTKEESVAFGEDVAARLRGEEPVADIAALAASRTAKVEAAHFVAWCKAEAFNDAVRRYHAWNAAPKDE